MLSAGLVHARLLEAEQMSSHVTAASHLLKLKMTFWMLCVSASMVFTI